MTHSTTTIIPHLWFDNEAKDAVHFYTAIFPDAKTITATTLTDTPSGTVDIITFQLWGDRFMAINAGPMFKFNPAVSFYVYCGSAAEIERLYNALSEGGKVLMPLDTYPWSEKYAWVQDKYGLSWQLDVSGTDSRQKIVPSLLFVNEKSGRVKEAVSYYTSVFPEAAVLLEAPYDKSAPVEEGTLLFAQFELNGYRFNAMSSIIKHDHDFNEAVSFMV
ncbi:MAG: VOC family protein, partial [Sinomicrobium sp.]|nr:VOC family protein [Sinomicrobium sp.]